jgi:hypothetical protein
MFVISRYYSTCRLFNGKSTLRNLLVPSKVQILLHKQFFIPVSLVHDMGRVFSNWVTSSGQQPPWFQIWFNKNHSSFFITLLTPHHKSHLASCLSIGKFESAIGPRMGQKTERTHQVYYPVPHHIGHSQISPSLVWWVVNVFAIPWWRYHSGVCCKHLVTCFLGWSIWKMEHLRSTQCFILYVSEAGLADCFESLKKLRYFRFMTCSGKTFCQGSTIF